MAQALNKNRMFYSQLIFLLIILLGICANTILKSEDMSHEMMELIGYVLVVACVLGRVHASAYIGGLKNEQLITWGPYSITRNPLYFYSYLGAIGIAFASTSLWAVILAALGVYVLYHRLMTREESFLKEKFGQSYQDYCARTPRLFPRFWGYDCPEELPFRPRFLSKATLDALWWFVPLPFFESIEFLNLHTHLDQAILAFLASLLGT